MLVSASSSWAYTTASPEVVAMVDKACQFLASEDHDKPGGKGLIGLALLKNEATYDHPKIRVMADAIAHEVNENGGSFDIYSTGICIIFLCDYDSKRYRSEIQKLLDALYEKQKDHGGWGYPNRKTGDTSMTQYGVLSSWSAQRAKFNVPLRVIENVADWLMKTQDPSGAWGYQGKIGKDGKLIRQVNVRHTLAAAGLASIYICGDFFGMFPKLKQGDSGISKALERITDGKDKKTGEPANGKTSKKVRTRISAQSVRATWARGNGWFAKNYTICPKKDTLYYLYALERYGSFKAFAEGKGHLDPAKVEGPAWYNDGVKWLKKTQKEEGSWDARGSCDPVVNTAFGVLFLLRSTQKMIAPKKSLGRGDMMGGVGLPQDGEYIGKDGNVRKKTTVGRGASLIGDLDRIKWDTIARDQKFQGTDRSELLLSEFEKKMADPSPEKRLQAVRLIIVRGDMNGIPLLILALNDKNLGIVEEARDGLRRLSRRVHGFGMPRDPLPRERQRAIEQWQAWYLSIRPDTEF
jgi:hypothetical protein